MNIDMDKLAIFAGLELSNEQKKLYKKYLHDFIEIAKIMPDECMAFEPVMHGSDMKKNFRKDEKAPSSDGICFEKAQQDGGYFMAQGIRGEV